MSETLHETKHGGRLLESVMTVFFRQTEDPLAGAEGLLYKNWSCQEPLDDLSRVVSDLLSTAGHVLSRPSALFLIFAMAFRHVRSARRVVMTRVFPFVYCHAFMVVIDLHYIPGISYKDAFAGKLIGYTIEMPVFSKHDVIILLHRILCGLVVCESRLWQCL